MPCVQHSHERYLIWQLNTQLVTQLSVDAVLTFVGSEFEDIKSKDVSRVKRALANIRAALEQRSVPQHLLLSKHVLDPFQLKSALLHLCGGHFPEEYAITDPQVVVCYPMLKMCENNFAAV